MTHNMREHIERLAARLSLYEKLKSKIFMYYLMIKYKFFYNKK